jgi:dienelactone hydrolase
MRRAIATFALLLTAWNAPAADGAAFTTEPGQPLLDDVVRIRLTGVQPGAAVTIKAEAELRGRTFRSRATFTADESGRVDVLRQAPTAGTYSGVDPMGLFWSMEAEPSAGTGLVPPAPPLTEPRLTRLIAEVDGQAVATSELKRWPAKPGVRVADVRKDGLVGRFFESPEPGRRPAVLVLSGSEGGMNEVEAALLASHGYHALALAYFNAEGLPKQLVKIPLEYVKSGIDWLRARDNVDGERLAVVGGSKGGELALLLGATFPEIKAVVASVPSHVVWSGIGGTFRDSSWTFKGQPLPCVATKPSATFFLQMSGNKPVRLLDMYVDGLVDEDAARRAAIPVEKIRGPVLLLSGGDDHVWPSARMAEAVVARLREHKHPHAIEHLSYDKAGHGIVSAYMPTRNTVVAGRMDLGGTPEANARAMADSRPKVLKFLADSLRPR